MNRKYDDDTTFTNMESFLKVSKRPSHSLMSSNNTKQSFKAFCNLVLKIKFEKLAPEHKALKMSERHLWEKCLANNIVKENWMDYILNEMNNAVETNSISDQGRLSKVLKRKT